MSVVKARPAPGQLELQDRAIPDLAINEVLVQVEAASLCGSDLNIQAWTPSVRDFVRPPVTIGHEFTGCVIAASSEADQQLVGQRVCIESVVACLTCDACRRGQTNICPSRQLFGVHRPGGMANYVAVPSHVVHPISDAVPARSATLAEPLAVAVRAIGIASIEMLDRVLVTGAGAIGIFSAQLASLKGAVVTLLGADVDRARLDLAANLGIDVAFSPDEIDAAYDLIVECSGSADAVALALRHVRPGGQVLMVGLPHSALSVDLPAAVRREVWLRGSYASTWRDFHLAVKLIVEERIQTVPMTTTFPLADFDAAFRMAADRTVLKPVLVP